MVIYTGEPDKAMIELGEDDQIACIPETLDRHHHALRDMKGS